MLGYTCVPPSCEAYSGGCAGSDESCRYQGRKGCAGHTTGAQKIKLSKQAETYILMGKKKFHHEFRKDTNVTRNTNSSTSISTSKVRRRWRHPPSRRALRSLHRCRSRSRRIDPPPGYGRRQLSGLLLLLGQLSGNLKQGHGQGQPGNAIAQEETAVGTAGGEKMLRRAGGRAGGGWLALKAGLHFTEQTA